MAKKSAGTPIEMLSARFVESEKAVGLYGDGHNLFLKIDERGNKSWMLRWSSGGRVRKMGLGPVHAVSLAEARKKAEAARKLIHDG